MSIVLDGSNGITTNSGTVVSTTDATLNGLTVGKGGGSISTNTAVGANALNATNTGGYCLAVGTQALYSNTSGTPNTAIGYQALYSNVTSGDNVAVGHNALYTNNGGNNNTAIGDYALRLNTTASNNTAVGYQAGYNNTTNGSNTYLGYQSGYNVTTGGSNIFIGSAAGAYTTPITTGSQNIMIGFAGGSSASVSNEIVIATATSSGKGANTGFINPNGGTVYQGNNSTLWSVTSDQRLKKNIVDHTEGLNKIVQLKVRNFEYKTEEEITELDPKNAVKIEGVQLGLIAQELQEVLPDCVKTESTGVMSVDATNITWHMINAIKDLKALVDAQATEIAELKAKG